ncbi:MAG TPA: TrkH family potassium uptake protein [Kiritimatiellia bacterium]|nr:TrkH family potassium uptake protein [Kiritimatiellia bacterium]
MMIAAALGLTLVVSYTSHDPTDAIRGFLYSFLLTLGASIALWAGTRGPVELSRRDGILIVVLGWVMAILVGMLPFLLSEPPGTAGWADALFESTSGFTTTGASILSDLENHPRGVLFWRAMTHFLGGMGILVLCVAIIPFLGVGGMQIYRAEVAGPQKDRLTPRIASTAKFLWGIYISLAVLLTGLLRWAGMNGFDAVCHAMSTVSTGGFSTRSASIAAFNSPLIEAILIVFMFICSISFALHFQALRGDRAAYLRSPEVRFFFFLWLGLGLAIGLDGWWSSEASLGGSLRDSLFTVTSILTTTGFGTADYDQWSSLAKMLLVLAMFIGGCAGSTSGGIKAIRILVLLKKLTREIRLFLRPQAVYPVKLGRQILEPSIVAGISVFFFIFTMTFTAGCLVMALYTEDLITGVSSVIAALGNIGPGLGDVGPAQTYATMPQGAKVTLSLLMLLGRLELYTLLVLLMPGFWRKS